MGAKKNSDKKGVTRRDFIKGSAILGGSLMASQLDWAQDLIRRAEAGLLTPEEAYELVKPENTLYTVCLQCNTGCGIKAKLFRKNGNGVALKIDGNPYCPFASLPNLAYSSSPFDVNTIDSAICPKGQAGIQTAYDPYRVTKVLKRAGKRGENKWTTVPFDQAISEIVNGGRIFAHVPGEESREVTGLKDIYVLKDQKIAKEMRPTQTPSFQPRTKRRR